jgi:hypothetical protein
VRSLPSTINDESWGPSDEDLQISATAEVTGKWADESGSEEELSTSCGDNSEASGDIDWAGPDDDGSDCELMESFETMALVDEYRLDGISSSIPYDAQNASRSEGLHYKLDVSSSKRPRIK